MVREEIVSALKGALKELGLADVDPTLEVPNEPSHGDYSSNIAMTILSKSKINPSASLRARIQKSKLLASLKLWRSGQVKIQKYKNPLELAEKIVSKLKENTNLQALISNIQAVPPGFINFHLSKDYLISQLASQGEAWEAKKGGGKVMVEFTDPNPFKEFHIGHLYSNIVGESLCRLLEAEGAEVKRANYQGDVGMHVAKALYGLLQMANLDKKPLNERVKILGEAYALGAKAYEEDETAKKEINELNKKVYQQDPTVMDIYNKGKQWSLDYFESIYKRLGTKFDFYYFESRVGKIGLKLVKEHLGKPFGKAQGKGVFEESEGAVIFPGKQFGLHTRVFINSLGLPTYEAKELGLAPTKYEEFPYDKSIIVTGNEIIEYFKVLLSALAKIRPDLAAKTKHIAHGMVRLAQGKMSSRTGNVITGQWLLDEAKTKIKERFGDINEQTAEQVAVGAVKYALLKSGIGKDIAFSFEESISLEGNSGPYLQYTYARTQSVLAKFKIQNSKFKITNQNLKIETEEMALLRLLHRFPEVASEAADKFAPNLLCDYLFNLAQNFNLFYQKHPILKSAGAVRDFRLALTSAVGQTIKNGLYLLGIEAPERM